MTKDQIVQNALIRININDGTNEIGNYMSDAMDEYAKQQAIAFMKSEDAKHNQLVKDNVYEEMYRQFIEQQQSK